jgi:predicted AlkP superfamily phosphohydrolase/phosphomutase
VNKSLQVDTEQLKKDLMGLRHKGRPVVKDIYPWYGGRSAETFNPDFVVEFHQGYSIKHRLHSRRHILSKGYPLFEPTMAHGNHSINGFFCISGDNIKENYESSADIVDVMPTLLNILKVATPKGIDGTLMKGIFITSSESEFTDSSHLSKTHKTVGDENFDAVADMLKSLGYLQ